MASPSREPAAYAEVVRLIIAALVGLGWITLDEPTVNAIVTVAGAVVSIVLTIIVRANVTPLPSPDSDA